MPIFLRPELRVIWWIVSRNVKAHRETPARFDWRGQISDLDGKVNVIGRAGSRVADWLRNGHRSDVVLRLLIGVVANRVSQKLDTRRVASTRRFHPRADGKIGNVTRAAVALSVHRDDAITVRSYRRIATAIIVTGSVAKLSTDLRFGAGRASNAAIDLVTADVVSAIIWRSPLKVVRLIIATA